MSLGQVCWLCRLTMSAVISVQRMYRVSMTAWISLLRKTEWCSQKPASCFLMGSIRLHLRYYCSQMYDGTEIQVYLCTMFMWWREISVIRILRTIQVHFHKCNHTSLFWVHYCCNYQGYNETKCTSVWCVSYIKHAKICTFLWVLFKFNRYVTE